MKLEGIKKISVIVTCLLSFSGLRINAQDIKDFDGQVYKTAKYGKQVWTANNLNVAHFRNGDAISEAKTDEEWNNAATSGNPAWRCYENDPENGKKYGKLYNWFAINDPRALAPEGWRIPANPDWMQLVKNLLGVEVAGAKIKSATEWKSRPGTNNFGFTAIPGGYCDSKGKFMDLGRVARWWSNSVPIDSKPSDKIFTLMINDISAEIHYLQSEKGAGYSVRCIKE